VRIPPTTTALVTGGAGFIGSHTVDALLADEWRVVVVDDLSTGEAGKVSDRADLEVVDISDRTTLDRVVDAAKPSAVFHLAAQSSVTRSVADPERDCEINVHGTLNVLEAASRHAASVVFTSTGGALYGNRAPIPTPEDTCPAPISPYGASKWAGEAYTVTWREATGLPHSVCRLGNVYGPRQNPHGEAGVVAILSHHLWSGKTPKLYGFGSATRDYVHVHDVAQALLAALGKGGTFNVSTGVETDVLYIFAALQDAAGTRIQPELVPLRPGELQRSCMDPSRAMEQLDWQTVIGLKEGLRETYHAMLEGFGSKATSDRP
jgi:UDP-glucose 4-epimerase